MSVERELEMNFEVRGIDIKLLRALYALALRQNPDAAYWTVAHVSALLVGNHEILTPSLFKEGGNRFGIDLRDEGESARQATLTFDGRCSLIELLRTRYSEEPHPQLQITYDQCVGRKANVFVSFPYLMKFGDLVNALEEYLQRQSSAEMATFFWFDMVVNNQWVATEKPFDWWTGTFKNAIKEIGSVLTVMSPWDNPISLTRVWCVFELYACVSTGSKFDVGMTSEESHEFTQKMVQNPMAYFDMLGKIDSSKSTAWHKEDADRIIEVIRQEVGFVRMDSMVFRTLEKWMESELMKKIAASQSAAALYEVNNDGSHGDYSQFVVLVKVLDRYFELSGDSKKGLPLLETGLQVLRNHLGRAHLETLHFSAFLSQKFLALDLVEQAEKLVTEGLELVVQVETEEGLQSRQTRLYVSLALKKAKGELLMLQKKLAEALPILTLVVKIYKYSRNDARVWEANADVLLALKALATCNLELKKDADKLRALVGVYVGSRELNGEFHADTFAAMSELWNNSNVPSSVSIHLATSALEQARTINGASHPHTLSIMRRVAQLRVQSGTNVNLALRIEQECFEEIQRELPRGHPETIRAIKSLLNAHATARIGLDNLNVDMAYFASYLIPSSIFKTLMWPTKEEITLKTELVNALRLARGDGDPETIEHVLELVSCLAQGQDFPTAVLFCKDILKGGSLSLVGRIKVQTALARVCAQECKHMTRVGENPGRVRELYQEAFNLLMDNLEQGAKFQGGVEDAFKDTTTASTGSVDGGEIREISASSLLAKFEFLKDWDQTVPLLKQFAEKCNDAAMCKLVHSKLWIFDPVRYILCWAFMHVLEFLPLLLFLSVLCYSICSMSHYVGYASSIIADSVERSQLQQANISLFFFTATLLGFSCSESYESRKELFESISMPTSSGLLGLLVNTAHRFLCVRVFDFSFIWLIHQFLRVAQILKAVATIVCRKLNLGFFVNFLPSIIIVNCGNFFPLALVREAYSWLTFGQIDIAFEKMDTFGEAYTSAVIFYSLFDSVGNSKAKEKGLMGQIVSPIAKCYSIFIWFRYGFVAFFFAEKLWELVYRFSIFMGSALVMLLRTIGVDLMPLRHKILFETNLFWLLFFTLLRWILRPWMSIIMDIALSFSSTEFLDAFKQIASILPFYLGFAGACICDMAETGVRESLSPVEEETWLKLAVLYASPSSHLGVTTFTNFVCKLAKTHRYKLGEAGACETVAKAFDEMILAQKDLLKAVAALATDEPRNKDRIMAAPRALESIVFCLKLHWFNTQQVETIEAGCAAIQALASDHPRIAQEFAKLGIKDVLAWIESNRDLPSSTRAIARSLLVKTF